MQYIGCDVINLNSHWEINTLRQKRLGKLYRAEEVGFLRKINGNAKIAEAILWSAKESAYKALHLGEMKFNPKQFCLQRISNNSLLVKYKREQIWVRYFMEHNFVFTYTIDPLVSKKSFVFIKEIVGEESAEIKAQLLSHLTNTHPGKWEIYKTDYGKPYLKHNNKVSTKKVSISHDSPYIAFVLCN